MKLVEDVRCALCNRDNKKVLYAFSSEEIPDSEFLGNKSLQQKFRYVKCSFCGLVYLNPRIRYHVLMDSYKKATTIEKMCLKKKDKRKYIKRMEEISKYANVDRGNILDIGSGFGFFLNVAKKMGWNAIGTEPSFQFYKYSKRFGVKVWNKPFEKCKFPENFFHSITMLDVLEHIYDPLRLLMKCKSILNENGVLVIRTPDVNSIYRYLKGKKWYFGLNHVNLFSDRSMKYLYKKTGFSMVKTY
jgi:SAM-dependent methyltransferase